MTTDASAKRRTRTKAPGVYRSVSGNYEIAYRDSDGRQVIRVVNGGFEDAKAARAEVVGKLSRGEPVRRSKTTFGEFAESVVDGLNGRPRTTEAHRYQLERHLLPRFRKRRLADISTDDVAKLVGEMKRGVYYEKVDGRYCRRDRKQGFAGWTISGTLSTLSLVMRRAKRRGLIPANPVMDLAADERPKTNGGDAKRVLEVDEIRRLLKAAGPTFRPLIAVLLCTGVRLGEALGLRWADVDSEIGLLHVRNQLDQQRQLAPLKTQSSRRDIELDPEFGKLLTAHRLASRHSHDTDYVFPAPDGRGRDHRSAGRGIERAVTKASLGEGVSAHSFRHTFASRLILAGFDPVRVSKRLGHSNPAFTLKTYSHAFEQAQHAEEIRRKMGEINSPMLAAVNEMSSGARNQPQPRALQTPRIRPVTG